MKMTTTINRRSALATIAATPLAALPAVALGGAGQTEIQSLYRDWLALTKDYFVVDAKWDRGEIDDIGFEQLADPILDRRFEIEDQISALDSQSTNDLAIKTKIAVHYRWGDSDVQNSLSVDAARFLERRPRNLNRRDSHAA